jgi:transposase InsO family protein
VYKHFTSHDVISKWNVFTSATSANAARFLDEMIERMPFNVNSIRIDGGPEFQSVFEEKCRKLGIKLFVLPPRSPKLNGGVERAHRTHSEEFYEATVLLTEVYFYEKTL